MSQQPHMDPVSFFDEGYAQEINLMLLHPLGLSLYLFKQNGVYQIGVADYRKLPYGILYSDKVMLQEDFLRKSKRFNQEYGDKAAKRYAQYGFIIQGDPKVRKNDGNFME